MVAASHPHRLRHLSAMVLQCLRHGVWGGGSGGLAAMSGPLRAIPIHANRADSRSRQRMCPAQLCRGTVTGRGEPANRCWGARGNTDHVNDMPPVAGGKSTNCGSGAWPQQLQRVRMNPFLAYCDERLLVTSPGPAGRNHCRVWLAATPFPLEHGPRPRALRIHAARSAFIWGQAFAARLTN